MHGMGRTALGAAVAVICGLAGCAGEGQGAVGPLAARRCTLQLSGPITGQFPCEGVVFRREEGWVLSATLPPGSRVAGSLLVPVSLPAEAASNELPGARAVLREPTRAGLGAIWGGAPRGRASLALGLDGRPASAQVTAVVPPLRANPAEEPVQVALRLELGGPGYVARGQR